MYHDSMTIRPNLRLHIDIQKQDYVYFGMVPPYQHLYDSLSRFILRIHVRINVQYVSTNVVAIARDCPCL